MAESKLQTDLSQKIILRSVRGKVGNIIKIQPCKNPETSEYADCVKRVDSNGDMILSEKERNDPSIIKASRKQRIANGSGRTVQEVNRLLEQFENYKKMMKQVSSGNFKMPF